jgi:dTDP-4-dehydrorhamnose reductase
MVFAGDAAPYCESDPPQPLSRYAQTKLAAEQFLTGCRHVATVRLPLMYGFPCGSRATTFVKQIAALRAGEPLSLFADEFRTPVWLVDAARVLIGLARSDFTGLIHVAGPDRLSRYELIANCAALLNIAAPRLVPISRHDGDAPEPRPEDLSLDASHFQALFPNLCPGPLRESVFTTA